ncbi:MAG: YciI family protein [Terracidiphilus sp.]|jgi:uncharacterized protein YciI
MLPVMKNLTLAALSLAATSVCALAQQAPAPASQPAIAQKTWLVRLIPPRPTFNKDLTDVERKLMEEHFVYLKSEYEKGVLLFAGPVLDPRGVYGVLVIQAADEAEATSIASADPSVKAGVNRIEVAEMHVAFPPKAQ